MRKVLFILFIFILNNTYSQYYLPLRNPVRIVYQGDTCQIAFDTDTVLFDGNKDFYKIDGGVIVPDSIKLTNNWYTSIPSYTFSNGLINTNDIIRLGDSLSQNTSIQLDGNSFQLVEQSGLMGFLIDPSNAGAGLSAYSSGSDGSYLSLSGTSGSQQSLLKTVESGGISVGFDALIGTGSPLLTLNADDGINEIKIKLDEDRGWVERDGTEIFSFDETGIYFDSDLSGGYTDRHAVDKGYVDNAVGGSIDTAGGQGANEVAYWTNSTTLGGTTTPTLDTVLFNASGKILFDGGGKIYGANEGLAFFDDETTTSTMFYDDDQLYGNKTTGFLINVETTDASNPQYSRVDDDNTGMWLPGSDVINLQIGGSSALNIQSSNSSFYSYWNISSSTGIQNSSSADGIRLKEGNSSMSTAMFMPDKGSNSGLGGLDGDISLVQADEMMIGIFNDSIVVVDSSFFGDFMFYQKHASLSDTLPLVLYSDGTTARIDTAGKSEVPTWMLSEYKLQSFEDYFNNVLETGELGLPYKKNGKIYEKHRLNKSVLIADNQILAEIERNYRYDAQLRDEIKELKSIINNQQQLIDELYKKLKEAYIIR